MVVLQVEGTVAGFLVEPQHAVLRFEGIVAGTRNKLGSLVAGFLVEPQHAVLRFGGIVGGTRDRLGSFVAGFLVWSRHAVLGFEEMLAPRYYAPLTPWGAFCISSKLHQGLIGIVPHSLIRLGIGARAKWYDFISRRRISR